MTHRVKDLPYEMQPRAQVRYLGIDKVRADVLLAVLLRTGVPGRNALETAQDLLQSFGSLEALSDATWQAIRAKRVAGVGEVASMVIACAFELQRRAVDAQHKIILKELHCVSDVEDVIYESCRKLTQETVFVLPLDNANKMLSSPVAIAKGWRCGVDFDIGKIFETSLRYSSAKFILVHNHPSGDPRPSSEDLVITRRILEAARIIGIEVVDHIIIGGENERSFSIAESGLVSFCSLS